MSRRGHLTRAQIVAAFWGLFGFYMAGTGVKSFFDSGLDVAAAGYVVLGVFGGVLAAVYLKNPDQVASGSERADWRAEVAIVFALVFVAVVSLVVLLA